MKIYKKHPSPQRGFSPRYLFQLGVKPLQLLFALCAWRRYHVASALGVLFALPFKLLPHKIMRKLSSTQRLFVNMVIASIILVFGIWIATSLLNPDQTKAAWFNDSWKYRQAITVTVSSSASDITNLETLLTVDTTGITSKVRTNCEDLRFTNTNGTILPYYIDSCSNNSATNKIWVLTDLVPKNTTTYTLYMYYGNSSANSLSNTTKFNLLRGLVGYFTKNDGSGNATDSSVTGTDGTLSIGASGTQTTTTQAWSNGASGRYSSSLNFDGTDDKVSVSSSAYALSNALTLSAWIYPTTSSGSHNILSNANPWDYRLYQSGLNLAMQVALDDGNTGYHTANNVLTANTWQHVVGIFTGSRKQIYVNGVQVLDVSHSGTIQTPASSVVIGSYGSGEYFQGRIDDARVYNRGLSQEEVIALYSNPGKIATTAPATSKPTTTFASEEQSPGPVAYWSMDEGNGSIVYDQTSNSNNGTISGAAWKPESECKAGRCLYFDGTNDAVDFGNISTRASVSGNLTIAFWMKPTNITKGRQNPLGKAYGGEFNFTLETNGSLSHYWGSAGGDAAPWTQMNQSTSRNLVQNEWTHVVITRNTASRTVSYYINGKFDKSQTYTSTYDPVVSTRSFKFGYEYAGYYQGYLDEVVIFSTTKSANEIKALYSSGQAGSSVKKGTSGILGSANQSSMNNGLVGYWKMDEASWNGTSGEVVDSSGNGNNGTSVLGAEASPSAKFGRAGYFAGSDEYVSVADSSTVKTFNQMTISAWINASSCNGSGVNDIVNKESSAYVFRLNSCRFNGGVYASNGWVTLQPSTALSTGVWHHVVMTYDGIKIRVFVDGSYISSPVNGNGTSEYQSGSVGTNTNPLLIGANAAGAGRYFNGNIDEVRIYNRALSPTEIQQLYSFAPGPVAYYDFEEKGGTTVNDKSGNGHSGTWNGTGTHYSTGVYGSAGKFNGSDDWINVGGTLGVIGDSTVEAWVYPEDTGTTGTYGIMGNSQATRLTWSGTTFQYFINNNSWSPTYRYVQTSSSYPLNKWYHVTGVRDSQTSTLKIYINGVLTNTTTGIPSETVTDLGWTIVKRDSNIGFKGKMDEIRVYNYARTPGQIISDMNAGHPIGGSPIGSQYAYYKFDEGYGSSAHNSGSQTSLVGTLTPGASGSNTTATAMWTQEGKYNRGIEFDGTDDFIDLGLHSIGPVINGATQVTASSWIKLHSLPTAGNTFQLFAATNSTGGSVDIKINETGTISPGGRSTAGDGFQSITSNTALTTNRWYYVAAVYDYPNDLIKVYIDGKLDKSGSVTFGATSYTDSANASLNDQIGNFEGQTRYFKGIIDNFKLYGTGLTNSEILIDYNQNSSLSLGTLGTSSDGKTASSSASTAYCIPGDTSTCNPPVAEWTLNEGQGTTANDTSGNGNDGTLTNSPKWTQGKLGSGLLFNGTGSNMYVQDSSVTGLPTSQVTVAAWVKINTHKDWNRIVNHDWVGDGWLLYGNSSGSVNFGVGQGGVQYTATKTGVSTGQWHYVVGTYDGTNVNVYVDGAKGTSAALASGTLDNAGLVEISGTSGNTMDGSIDQMQVYNYARTPAQIAYDYNRGKPVASWDFDECQGSVLHDLISGNNGTITIGGTGTQTSAGTCQTASTAWGNGATGKFNYSLNFDDTDDYVSIPDPTSGILDFGTSDFSLSVWTYRTSNSGTDIIIGKRVYPPGYIIYYSGTSLVMQVNDTSAHSYTLGTLSDTNTWHLITTVVKRSTNQLLYYLDGKLKNTIDISATTGSVDNAGYFGIGRDQSDGTNLFPGKIDDVQVFNYALTTAQVKTLMNQGGAVRFGPISGTP